MAYVIMRCEKIKGAGKLAASAAHLNRSRECENADPNLKDSNVLFGNLSVEAVMADWREQLSKVDRKIRSDAVGALEYLFAYSPDAPKLQTREAQDKYFLECSAWLEKRHGKDRVLIGAVHYDEVGGPHMHVLVVPILERVNSSGKKVLSLNAKHWMDGGKKLSQAQTEIGKIGKEFGLERGIEKSTARHQKVKRLYGLLDRPEIDQIQVPEKKALENLEAYTRRVQKAVQRQVETAFGLAREKLKELEMRPSKSAYDDLDAKLKDLNNAFTKFRKYFEKATPEQLKDFQKHQAAERSRERPTKDQSQGMGLE